MISHAQYSELLPADELTSGDDSALDDSALDDESKYPLLPLLDSGRLLPLLSLGVLPLLLLADPYMLRVRVQPAMDWRGKRN